MVERSRKRISGSNGNALSTEMGWRCTIVSRCATFRREAIQFSLTLSFAADFNDVFEVRGMVRKQLGRVLPPDWGDGILSLIYEGSDSLFRGVQVRFSPKPQRTSNRTAHFQMKIPARGTQKLNATLILREGKARDGASPDVFEVKEVSNVRDSHRRSSDAWLAEQTQIRSDSLFVERILDRSLRDLRVLRTALDGKEFYAAGVPWFVTLFGRDSIIAAMQTLLFEPRIAEPTLRLLAAKQGTHVDEWRDEAPGKILHELRVGELANLGEIPHSRYYGTIDATPLFLILLARHANVVGNLDLFHELRENVDQALQWIDDAGEKNGDGYLAYNSPVKSALINQGWKDSGDAIVNEDGSLAHPPIALVEVQGYLYRAKLDLAELFERDGEADRAKAARRRPGDARALQQRFLARG